MKVTPDRSTTRSSRPATISAVRTACNAGAGNRSCSPSIQTTTRSPSRHTRGGGGGQSWCSEPAGEANGAMIHPPTRIDPRRVPPYKSARPRTVEIWPSNDPVTGLVLAGEAGERGVEVALLLGPVAGLPQFVARRVGERADAVADRGVGVTAQPAGRLHDVGVGVVHDEPGLVVRHAISPLGCAGRCGGERSVRPGHRARATASSRRTYTTSGTSAAGMAASSE